MRAIARLLLVSMLACTAIATPAAAQDDDPPPSPPPPDSGDDPPMHMLAESETAYIGAIMLEGGTDITMGEVVHGSIGDGASLRRSGRFVGNTLYAEATDGDGNTVALVAEFYWFESSIPRGSDFFVGVLKARTIPHLAANWVLEHDPVGPTDAIRSDRGATLYARAETNAELNYGGFRWDWSLPFRDYGMDAFGTIRMKADYGVGLMGNGSAQAAYQRNEMGVEVQVDGQATGHLTADYKVNTNYEITLYRWDVYTRNSAAMLEWTLFLRTSDRERQNAYHEYFIAMQAPEGEEFHIDRLEVGGNVVHSRPWWFDEHRALSVAVEDIVIKRPATAGMRRSTTDGGVRTDGGTSTRRDAGSDYDWPSEDDDFDSRAPKASSGCSVAVVGADAAAAPLLFVLALLGAAVVRLRKRS